MQNLPSHRLPFWAFCAVFVVITMLSAAAAERVETWLAKRGAAVVTRQDFENFLLAEVPLEHRPGFLASDKRVSDVIEGLLLGRQLEIEAEKTDLENDPVVQARLRRARQKILVQEFLERYGREHAGGDFAQLAYERYLANPASFDVPETVDVSHILISTRERDESAALTLAEEIEKQIRAGKLAFDDAVKQYSEDPSAARNLGRFPEVRRGMMVAPFEEAAFALSTLGEMSEPVKSTFGYHLIRFNGRTAAGRRSFDEVKASLIETAALEQRDAARNEFQRQLRNQPQEANNEAIQALIDDYLPPDVREEFRRAGQRPENPPSN